METSLTSTPDSFETWLQCYQLLAITGVRSVNVVHKTKLHLDRFKTFFEAAYGHDRISRCLRRDVLAWQTSLLNQKLAPATINNHLASLSAFTTWVQSQQPQLFPSGNPTKGVAELGLPPLEPRSLSLEQVRSLKSLCDRLERFHQLKGRRWTRLLRCNGTEIYASRTFVLIPVPTACFKGVESS